GVETPASPSRARPSFARDKTKLTPAAATVPTGRSAGAGTAGCRSAGCGSASAAGDRHVERAAVVAESVIVDAQIETPVIRHADRVRQGTDAERPVVADLRNQATHRHTRERIVVTGRREVVGSIG